MLLVICSGDEELEMLVTTGAGVDKQEAYLILDIDEVSRILDRLHIGVGNRVLGRVSCRPASATVLD